MQLLVQSSNYMGTRPLGITHRGIGAATARLLERHIPEAYHQQLLALRIKERAVLDERKALVAQMAAELNPILEALIPQLPTLYPEEFI